MAQTEIIKENIDEIVMEQTEIIKENIDEEIIKENIDEENIDEENIDEIVMSQTEIIKVNIDEIGFSEEILRVHKPEDIHIIDMANSIEEQGLLNLPSIAKDPMNPKKYVILDGARRLVAMKYIMLEDGRLEKHFPNGDMHLQLKPLETNMEILCAQVAGNANIVKTANRDYIRALFKIASNDKEGMPADELAKKAGISLNYMMKLFDTLKLPTKVSDAVREGGVLVGHTIALSKLAGKVDESELVEYWVEKAKSLNAKEFAVAVQDKLDIIKAGMQGVESKFELIPKMLKRDDIEILALQAKENFKEDPSIVNETRLQVFKELFQIDEVSAKEREDEYNRKEQEMKEKKEERKKARTEKKIKDSINDVENAGFVVVKKDESSNSDE